METSSLADTVSVSPEHKGSKLDAGTLVQIKNCSRIQVGCHVCGLSVCSICVCSTSRL